MKLQISEMQAYETNILREVVSICNRHNITYYFHCGSALGAVRHEGPIPWDYDADLIVPNDQIDRFKEIVSKELSESFYVDHYQENSEFEPLFPRLGLSGYDTKTLHIDVFRLIGIPELKQEQMTVIKRAWRLRMIYKFKSRRLKNCTSLKQVVFKILVSPISKAWVRKSFNELCSAVPFSEAKYVMNPFGKYKEKNIFRKEVYGDGQFVKYADFEARVASQLEFYLTQYYGEYMKFPKEESIRKQMEKEYIVNKL